ncbi:hypothetical protein PRUPE_6G312800 [Prunus persica]|uniref:Uncharacterized protein n=1 Tax=Prunus persica TaxID=3760 RepID=A0A251NYC8_PRUPE|nr:hypothetical protein PRUPE_6G312800 [Prunus persica]
MHPFCFNYLSKWSLDIILSFPLVHVYNKWYIYDHTHDVCAYVCMVMFSCHGMLSNYEVRPLIRQIMSKCVIMLSEFKI